MKLKTLASALLVTLMISSCDDSTGTIGTSITSDMDKLEIKTDLSMSPQNRLQLAMSFQETSTDILVSSKTQRLAHISRLTS